MPQTLLQSTLSHPEISFKFIRDNKVEILTAGDGKIYSAVYSVYGRDFANSMLEVDYTWQGMHITGFTVKPLSAKSLTDVFRISL